MKRLRLGSRIFRYALKSDFSSPSPHLSATTATMIKKVKARQLRVGVFIDDLDFRNSKGKVFLSKTLIQSEKTIQIILAWGVDEVFIDTEKGLDIKPGQSAIETRQRIDRDLRQTAVRSSPQAPVVPLREELAIAQTIKKEAYHTVQRAMDVIAQGKQLDTGDVFRLVEKMSQSVNRNRDALPLLMRIRSKDEYTLMHSISVGSLVLTFCNFCGLAYETTINMAVGALLHDVGKTQIPLQILNKPGRLTPQEMDIIKKHADFSADVMAHSKDLPIEAFDIALHHHERHDGSGYPHGLNGDTIGFAAKVAAICDVYDAMTSERCYKKAMGKLAGLKKLYELSASHFDQELTYKFIEMIGVYPIGTCVRLDNDLIGIVSGSTDNVLQPIVRLFYDDQIGKPIKIEELDLTKVRINIAGYETPASWDADKLKVYKSLQTALNPLTQTASAGGRL